MEGKETKLNKKFEKKNCNEDSKGDRKVKSAPKLKKSKKSKIQNKLNYPVKLPLIEPELSINRINPNKKINIQDTKKKNNNNININNINDINDINMNSSLYHNNNLLKKKRNRNIFKVIIRNEAVISNNKKEKRKKKIKKNKIKKNKKEEDNIDEFSKMTEEFIRQLETTFRNFFADLKKKFDIIPKAKSGEHKK